MQFCPCMKMASGSYIDSDTDSNMIIQNQFITMAAFCFHQFYEYTIITHTLSSGDPVSQVFLPMRIGWFIFVCPSHGVRPLLIRSLASKTLIVSCSPIQRLCFQ